MRYSNRLSLAILAFVSQAAAAVDCSRNVTISDSDDATQVRKACTTIEGSLVFKRHLSDDINLDGLETVLGHVTHYGCSVYEDDDCAKVSSLFNISSSTLTSINGSLYFENFWGLETLSFPNLGVVNGSVELDRNKNLTHLDITSLTHVGSFHMDGAVSLERLDHDRLEGLTDRRGSVVVMDSGNIDSLDSFSEYPITLPPGEEEMYLGFIMNQMENIKNLTFGWTNTSMVYIDGDNLTLTLGGPSTKSMYMEDFSTDADLIRSPDLENLTAMSVTIGDSSWLTKSPLRKVDVWFDDLWSVLISGSNITTVEMPSEAENWSSPRVWVNTQMTDIREYDDDGTKIWHWPKSLDSLTLEGSMNNSFFDSFFERNTTIVESLWVDEQSGEFNCTALKARFGSDLPSDYTCTSVKFKADDDDDDDDSKDGSKGDSKGDSDSNSTSTDTPANSATTVGLFQQWPVVAILAGLLLAI